MDISHIPPNSGGVFVIHRDGRTLRVSKRIEILECLSTSGVFRVQNKTPGRVVNVSGVDNDLKQAFFIKRTAYCLIFFI
ncbi:MAG: hypothetical protein LBK73_03170 [Treponema sp.]|jgi:hypothetical protein|nr:hypothetical protein [Treponema sp.]